MKKLYPAPHCRILAAVVAAGWCATAFGGSATCLDERTTYATTDAADNDAPFSVRACDLDGDGDLDLAAVNDASDTVSVLLNDGMGGFGTLRRWAVGPTGTPFEPVDLACCDFDGDGRLDLATANHLTDNVSVLFNVGNVEAVPQFSAATHHPVGEAPWAVRCARIDPDSHPDIVTANITSDDVVVLINDGTGGVSAGDSYTVPVGDGPRDMTLCDIDDDTDLDVITANLTGKGVTVLRNDGAAGLIDTGDTDLGVNAFGIACCDLDGTNGPDIVTANLVDDSVTTLFSEGKGAFGGLTRTGGSDGPASVTCSDVDHDGDVDVLVANLTADDVALFINNGAGALDLPTSLTSVPDPSSVVAAPLVGQGPDVAAAFADGVAVLPNNCPSGCQTDADCPDDGAYCNGSEICDAGVCTSTGSPCPDGATTCWEDTNTCELIGDLDRDGDADLADVARFQRCFGTSPSINCVPSDVDGTGVVDLGDYAAIYVHWSGPGGSQ